MTREADLGDDWLEGLARKYNRVASRSQMLRTEEHKAHELGTAVK